MIHEGNNQPEENDSLKDAYQQPNSVDSANGTWTCSQPNALPQVPSEENADKVNRRRSIAALDYGTQVFTGIRPTGSLTVANYVGAVKPTIELSASGLKPRVFVADLHALTTHHPAEVKDHTEQVVLDYMALGLDPEKAELFIQSDLSSEILELTAYLTRYTTVNELLRVPTLKDKIREGDASSASVFLALYPIMMASDILLQRAEIVPVGQDQLAHIEMTRRLAKKLNSELGEVLPMPSALEADIPVKIMGLKGSGKMGKSSPEEALFLDEPIVQIAKKIRKAKTALAGEMTPLLKSHVQLGKALTADSVLHDALDDTILRHITGEEVMGQFKGLLIDAIIPFVQRFQARKRELQATPELVTQILATGKQLAIETGTETISTIRNYLTC